MEICSYYQQCFNRFEFCNCLFQEEETPLHCASVRGNIDCVRVLVDAGANLDLKDKVRNVKYLIFVLSLLHVL